MPVVVRRPAPPLDGLITAITYRADEQPCTSVEKILPSPGTGLCVNLNRDEFRSFGDTGQVNRAPGAMISGPTSRASVIEFEAGHAHVSVGFALGAARCFVEAAVIEPYGGLHPGFVLAAQSLQGISGQQRSLTWSIAYFWLAAFAISFLIARLLPARTTRPRPPSLSELSG